jgi:hypothetical protein
MAINTPSHLSNVVAEHGQHFFQKEASATNLRQASNRTLPFLPNIAHQAARRLGPGSISFVGAIGSIHRILRLTD